jgi:hypothetical protein
MTLFQTDFSLTSRAASFINHQSNCKNNGAVIKFARQELLTRITALALPILALIDATVHTAGMVEATFYALYKGILTHQTPDFSTFLKHYRSVILFIRILIPLTFYGAIIPKQMLKILEDSDTECVNAILLSRAPEYSKDCTVSDLAIVNYLKKQISEMDTEHLKGMEDSLTLLNHAKKYLEQEKLYTIKKSMNKLKLTPTLKNWIGSLRDYDGALIPKFLFKECLSRLLSLGLSLTCAVDVISTLFLDTLFMLALILIELIMRKDIIGNYSNIIKLILSELRDTLINIAGTLTASLIGVIHPDTALKLVDQNSSWYKKFKFAGEDYSESIVQDLTNLENGASQLIPVSFATNNDSHIVYCLVRKINNTYEISILNKGFGLNQAELMLTVLSLLKKGFDIPQPEEIMDIGRALNKEKKHATNFTFQNATKKQATAFIRSLTELTSKSQSELTNLAKDSNLESFALNTLYPSHLRTGIHLTPLTAEIGANNLPDFKGSPGIMTCTPQAIGDCPKSSLFAALYYHSAYQNESPNPKPYKQWIRHLKDKVLKTDGHLIGHSLVLRNLDRKAKTVATDRLQNGWKRFNAQFVTV